VLCSYSNAYFNADADPESNAITYPNFDAYFDSNRNADSHTYCDTNTDGNDHTYRNSDADCFSKTDSNAETAPDTVTASDTPTLTVKKIMSRRSDLQYPVSDGDRVRCKSS
jgi:hypothetical protein